MERAGRSVIFDALAWILTAVVVAACWALVYWPIRPTYRDRKPWNVD